MPYTVHTTQYRQRFMLLNHNIVIFLSFLNKAYTLQYVYISLKCEVCEVYYLPLLHMGKHFGLQLLITSCTLYQPTLMKVLFRSLSSTNWEDVKFCPAV